MRRTGAGRSMEVSQNVCESHPLPVVTLLAGGLLLAQLLLSPAPAGVQWNPTTSTPTSPAPWGWPPRTATHCSGTGRCWNCSGTGRALNDSKCTMCSGTGLCYYCGGKGVR